MKRSFSLAHLISAVFFSVVATVIITVTVVKEFNLFMPSGNYTYENKVSEILSLVEQFYVGDVDQKVLADNIVAGCIYGIGDKYSGYYTAESANERFDSLNGHFTGMGVQYTVHPNNKTMYIYKVHNGSPADLAGIIEGDEILKVDEIDIVKDGHAKALEYIKSKEIGTSINVIVLRNGTTVPLTVTLNQFDSQSVFPEMIGNKGYIYISEFNNNTTDQFVSAVKDLEAKGAAGLIIDLRGNGGGTLTSVTAMLDFLLPKGLIIETRYKDSRYNESSMSDSSEVSLPMTVLTDGGTASASELFAQSLKDYGKAVTIGCKTYGKGVVQRTFTLSDGSLVVFTVAKYYTKSGYCPDGQGVSADIETSWSDEELNQRIINGIKMDKDFLAAVDYLDGQLS